MSARLAAFEHPTRGLLQWRPLLQWLHEDGLISAADAKRVAQRFGAGDSSLHALVRLGGAGLTRAADGEALDTEALTEWLAGRVKLAYQRIDPLKADAGRVDEVMSVQYAERRGALPLLVRANEVHRLCGDPSRLRAAIGDLPAYSLEQTLASMLEAAS